MYIQLGIPPMTTPMPYVLSEYLNQVASEMAQKLTVADQQVQQMISQATYTPPVQFNPIQNSSQSNSNQTSNQSNSNQQSQHSSVDVLTQYQSAVANEAKTAGAQPASRNQSASGTQISMGVVNQPVGNSATGSSANANPSAVSKRSSVDVYA